MIDDQVLISAKELEELSEDLREKDYDVVEQWNCLKQLNEPELKKTLCRTLIEFASSKSHEGTACKAYSSPNFECGITRAYLVRRKSTYDKEIDLIKHEPANSPATQLGEARSYRDAALAQRTLTQA